MEKEEALKRYITHMGDRPAVFYWKEVPETNFWFDFDTNSICSDIGVSIKCKQYDDILDCIRDLYENIAAFYAGKGIVIHDKESW